MVIRKKSKSSKIVIDLTGPEGNVFNLISILKTTFRRSGAAELGDSIARQMMSGNYENAVKIFDTHLGDRFILER